MRAIQTIVFILLSTLSHSQNNSDTINIYLSDGFESDTVNLWINKFQVFNKQKLKSSPYYSLAGYPIQLIEHHDSLKIICTNYTNCVEGRIKNSEKLCIKLEYRDKKYKRKFNLNNGEYFIVGFSGPKGMDIWQLENQPWFY